MLNYLSLIPSFSTLGCFFFVKNSSKKSFSEILKTTIAAKTINLAHHGRGSTAETRIIAAPSKICPKGFFQSSKYPRIFFKKFFKLPRHSKFFGPFFF